MRFLRKIIEIPRADSIRNTSLLEKNQTKRNSVDSQDTHQKKENQLVKKGNRLRMNKMGEIVRKAAKNRGIGWRKITPKTIPHA